MPTVHVNADDFGLHRDIDRGIARCVEARRVTGFSICANGAAIDWSMARELAARARAGVHVTLVGERWLTRPEVRFGSWARLVPWLALPGRRAMLEQEVRAQVVAMIDAGLRPTHLDSHQHVHVMPTIWPTCAAIAAEFGIPRLRVPATPSRSIAKKSAAGRVLQALAQRRATLGSLPCIGIAAAGHNDVEILTRELIASAGADVELVAHPAIDTPSLRERYGEWQFDWTGETDALLSQAWGEACARLGYRIAPIE